MKDIPEEVWFFSVLEAFELINIANLEPSYLALTHLSNFIVHDFDELREANLYEIGNYLVQFGAIYLFEEPVNKAIHRLIWYFEGWVVREDESFKEREEALL